MTVARDIEKEAAARAAVAEIEDGMFVGLGTGSTVAFAIAALAERCRIGLNVTVVATSIRTEVFAGQLGIKVLDFSTLAAVDLCIDGVDEIDDAFRAIKGAGGAMLREKVVAQAATRMIAIADSSKLVAQLGHAPVPVEALSFALGFVEERIEALGGQPVLRLTDDGEAYLTDQGNHVLDCAFGAIGTPGDLAISLSQIPGVLGHGLFIGDIDVLYVGRGDAFEKKTISDRR
jgi:ribose 5-phosphate isomerase A